MSISRLIQKIDEKNNASVAGLDARIAYVPDHVRARHSCDGDAILEFNKTLIDALSDIVPAVKPQSAYYELLGAYGAVVLQKTIEYAQGKGMYVILDAKRGDIGATADAYAESYIAPGSSYNADSMTVNGYLGSDGVLPFVKCCGEKSIFVLVKTSNKSSGELQDMKLADGRLVYERMADMVSEWGKDSLSSCGYNNVGAVVGATYPEELKNLRERMKNTFFLIPGYGAQGGSAEGLKGAFDKNGHGGIVNSSRAIMCAWKKTDKNGLDYAEAARNEAIRMRDEINSVRGK
ncbi:MAG: orotidine-5'-phosphate decarboxylase [Clostridiales bacterium]|nr:orotidine-5'-phosphate decarboxylase [Clostridiales bacterium]